VNVFGDVSLIRTISIRFVRTGGRGPSNCLSCIVCTPIDLVCREPIGTHTTKCNRDDKCLVFAYLLIVFCLLPLLIYYLWFFSGPWHPRCLDGQISTLVKIPDIVCFRVRDGVFWHPSVTGTDSIAFGPFIFGGNLHSSRENPVGGCEKLPLLSIFHEFTGDIIIILPEFSTSLKGVTHASIFRGSQGG